MSVEIIGPALGWGSNVRCRNCGTLSQHLAFECPHSYIRTLGVAPPGFDARGQREPAAWAGAELTAAPRLAWRAFATTHNLPPSLNANGVWPAF